jgi:hypothetical protein
MGLVRYFYRRESSAGINRIFTVSYVYNRETGATEYGASVFRQERPNEIFVKAHHRHTAEQRRVKCPVKVSVSGQTWNEIEDQIRDSIRVNGVKGERV